MKTPNWVTKIMSGVLLAAFLAGCASTTPTPTLAPTANFQATLNAVRTESARTVVANLTQSAPTATPVTPATPTQTLAPTGTATATLPPLPTVTRTATFIPWTLTPTQAAWACVVTDYLPKATTTYDVGVNFDGSWAIKNTGKETWLHSDIDIRYSSGTKFQKTVDGIDLKTDVAGGDTVTVGIDMVAPSTAGTYSTVWVVARGDQVICNLPLTVTIK
jgi:hypothetical protein